MAVCKTVWNSLSLTPRGDFRLCSLSNDPKFNESVGFDDQNNVMNILTHSFEQGINSDKHKAVRLSEQQGQDWHELCSCCENRENAERNTIQNQSRRQYVNKAISAPIKFYDTKTGQVPWLPVSLDIHFGNVCNFKCIQCGPQYSNQWYDEWAAINGFGNNLHENGFGPNKVLLTKNKNDKWIDANEVKWWENEIWWEKFDKLLPTLEHLYLTGGEPMLLKQHDRLLDVIIASGRADQIKLEYDSNLSVINPRILDRWTKFKDIDLRVSIDAIGDKFELVRAGGKWNNMVSNIELVKSYQRKYPHIKIFRLTSCFQIATSHSMIETEEWCNDVGIPLSIRFVDSPKWHSTISLPRHMKQQLIDYYSSKPTYMVSDLIVNFLTSHLDVEDQTELRRFKKFMTYLDYSRKTNWEAVLPETAAMLKS